MASPQQGLKGLAGAIGFFFGALLLSALVGAATAVAQNTAFGTGALASNTTGTNDSAFGFNALFSNTSGSFNTAGGSSALFNNTAGSSNTASGREALLSNTTGGDNTASGFEALSSSTKGGANTASGFNALISNTKARLNIGLGFNAGSNIVAGSNNIDIGGAGIADESNTIRIGTNGTQKKTVIAGISGTPVLGADVTVNGNGQLGVLPSSARYKRDIHDMGGASASLMKLRPVTFRYKNDSSGTLQYGLVAEEVAHVYPELVTRGTDGKLQSVRYLELTSLLLNELQRQARENKELSRENRELRSEVAQVRAEQGRERTSFDERVSALERSAQASKPEAKLSTVALRTALRSQE
jgi:Chaperone of endosialidase